MLLLDLDLEHLCARILGLYPGEQIHERQDATCLAGGAYPLVIVLPVGAGGSRVGDERGGSQGGEDRTRERVDRPAARGWWWPPKYHRG